MPVALTPEQAIRHRLETIQQAIATRLCIGALFPERRSQCATEVTALKREAGRIAEDPHSFRLEEPWQIDDPERRELYVMLNVNSVFRTAPENHLLTDCLIEYWKTALEEVAAGNDEKEWARQCNEMRKDAETLRRSSIAPVETFAEYRGKTPEQLVFSIQKRLAILAEQSGQAKPDSKNPWRKAYTEAMQQINQRALWLLSESSQGLDWTNLQAGESHAMRAIKLKCQEEFDLLNAQTTQLESAFRQR